jgi:anti-sigma regulatory factor (Ser/Thr protein kinase)
VDASTAPGHTLTDFAVRSEAGNERTALARVADAVTGLGITGRRLDALKTAVAEATMNAIEHGNGNRAEVPVRVRVTAVPEAVIVAITDQGGLAAQAAQEAAEASPALPDLDAKLAGLQSPRGWGLFLIKNMVDDMTVSTDGSEHTIVLTMHLAEDLGQSSLSEDGDDAEHL